MGRFKKKRLPDAISRHADADGTDLVAQRALSSWAGMEALVDSRDLREIARKEMKRLKKLTGDAVPDDLMLRIEKLAGVLVKGDDLAGRAVKHFRLAGQFEEAAEIEKERAKEKRDNEKLREETIEDDRAEAAAAGDPLLPAAVTAEVFSPRTLHVIESARRRTVPMP